MSLNGSSYTTCDFATSKTEKKYEVSQTFKKKNTNLSLLLTISASFQMATQKSRIGLLHRNQFAKGIQLTWTIISKIYRKRKDQPKALPIQLSIAYLCDTNKKKIFHCLYLGEVAHSTLDALKTFNDVQNSHP